MEKIFLYRPDTHILSAIESVTLTTWVSETLELGGKHLLIDFRRVLFMDSRGLGGLVIAHNRAEKAGCLLGLCCLNGQARMLLEMSSLENVFHIYDTVEEFREAVQPCPSVA